MLQVYHIEILTVPVWAGMVAYVGSTMEEEEGHGKWHQVLQAAVAV